MTPPADDVSAEEKYLVDDYKTTRDALVRAIALAALDGEE